ncbi:MAG: hypothetical protein EZS28_052159 [Streblomastix strix]|uniref:Uncharacterized protein n=1 Tax=Streblomastix strix TaxID=222440 RepID=A0A5J4SJT2_9EUKA|nr:MAG: hypothetical protein EZS28_052159 [Streblomastix strix]
MIVATVEQMLMSIELLMVEQVVPQEQEILKRLTQLWCSVPQFDLSTICQVHSELNLSFQSEVQIHLQQASRLYVGKRRQQSPEQHDDR